MIARWYKFLLLGIVTGFIGAGFFLTPYGQALEEKFGLYWLFHLRGPIVAPDEVTVIALDQPSAMQFNLPLLPRLWPREMHAQLIKRLSAAGARIVVFDLIFDSPSAIPESDKQLAQAMREAGNTVLIERLTYRNTELPVDDNPKRSDIRHEGALRLLPDIADAALASAPFPLPKAERVSGYWTFKSSAGDFPTVPVTVLQLYMRPLHDALVRLLTATDSALAARLPAAMADRVDTEEWLLAMRQLFAADPQLAAAVQEKLRQDDTLSAAQKRHLAVLIAVYSGDEKRYLNFYGPPRTIRTVPYSEAYQLLATGKSAHAFKDKVVFIGFSGATQPEQDLVRDDYHTVFSNPDGLYISGVEIAATAFANLLENKSLTPLVQSDSLMILFLFGWGLGGVFQKVSTRRALAFGVLASSAYIFCAYYLFKQDAVWVPVVIPLLQIMFAFVGAEVVKHYWADEKARQLETQLTDIKKILGSSYPSLVIERILGKDRDEVGICGSCLTTDVEGYTTLSEPLDPGVLGHLMAQYRDVLKNPIKQHHGHVMDMTGDSMLAIWIADAQNGDTKIQACVAALELAAAVERFNRSRPGNQPRLPTRIGLHFGDMALCRGDGNYSVTGDVVNTTDRIQRANKMLKTHILLSSDANEGLDNFLIRALGNFLLTGRSRSVQLLELIAQRQMADREQFWLCEAFAHALAAYHAQQWEQAGDVFASILEKLPNDGPSQFYLALCQRLKRNEPVTGLWPIYKIDSK